MFKKTNTVYRFTQIKQKTAVQRVKRTVKPVFRTDISINAFTHG